MKINFIFYVQSYNQKNTPMTTFILSTLILAAISFLPIVFWGYTFSYVDPNIASKKRFILWIFAGIASVIPVLYFDTILWFFALNTQNIFIKVYSFYRFDEILWINTSGFLLLAAIFLFSLWVGFWLQKKDFSVQIFFKNFAIFSLAFFLISLLFYVLSLVFQSFPQLNPHVEGVSFQNLVFSSVKLIIFYYGIVAIVEEASKHFHFLSTGIFSIPNVKVWVLYAIYVALWFSFAENLLYFYGLFQAKWLGMDLVKVYFFRSSFALIVHLLCSSVLAYFFTLAYLREKRLFTLRYIQIFCFWILASIFLHALFDVSLSLGFSIVMFIYFIAGYLYITSIFYKNS